MKITQAIYSECANFTGIDFMIPMEDISFSLNMQAIHCPAVLIEPKQF